MATAPAPSVAAAGGGSTKSTKSAAKKATKAGATKPKAPRKTKKAGGSSKATLNPSQQAYAAARAAQMDLARIRNEEAARRLDPLWYKAEDILPSVADESLMAEHAKFLPEQIQIVENALAKNNLTRSDITPQAFACLLEQARRFAIEILTDSQDYAFVAGRTEIDRADLMLANEFRPDHPIAVSTQLPKLNLLAQTVNRMPLPPIPTQCYSGVLLPPKNHQLTARTFDVVTSAQTARRMVQAAPPPPHKIKTGKKKAASWSSSSAKEDKSSKPSYGAARGRQISVNLKKKEEPKKPEVEAAKKPDAETKKPEVTLEESKKSEAEMKKPEETPVESKKPEAEIKTMALPGEGDTMMEIDPTEKTPLAKEEGDSSAAPTSASAVPASPSTGTNFEKEEEGDDDDDKMDVDKGKETLAVTTNTASTIEAATLAPSRESVVKTKTDDGDDKDKKEETKDGATPMDTSPAKP